MKHLPLVLAAGLWLPVCGCSQFGNAPQATGTLTGSLAGAALGSVAARAMDDSDRRRAAVSLDGGPDGQPSAWRNPETGDRFIFTPLRSFTLDGARCRDFRVEATVGGRSDSIAGSACRQADGGWRVRG
ncbi:MAG: RT0821/Lpp0805 family surface protein [Pseudomonadota bacterium]|nr:RT0821/Lpp0805 family surface protein [Pseudomonadota bacterium]